MTKNQWHTTYNSMFHASRVLNCRKPQEMTGNRVMAGFIGEVLATHPTRVFTLFVFNHRLESRWNLCISDSKGKCMGNHFQTSFLVLAGERVVANNWALCLSTKKTEFPTLMHHAKGMLRNNSCALIDEAGMLLLCLSFALDLSWHRVFSDPSFAMKYGHAYGIVP